MGGGGGFVAGFRAVGWYDCICTTWMVNGRDDMKGCFWNAEATVLSHESSGQQGSCGCVKTRRRRKWTARPVADNGSSVPVRHGGVDLVHVGGEAPQLHVRRVDNELRVRQLPRHRHVRVRVRVHLCWWACGVRGGGVCGGVRFRFRFRLAQCQLKVTMRLGMSERVVSTTGSKVAATS